MHTSSIQGLRETRHTYEEGVPYAVARVGDERIIVVVVVIRLIRSEDDGDDVEDDEQEPDDDLNGAQPHRLGGLVALQGTAANAIRLHRSCLRVGIEPIKRNDNSDSTLRAVRLPGTTNAVRRASKFPFQLV
jgi:hypothetical protein